jgi:hypothetical protein
VSEVQAGQILLLLLCRLLQLAVVAVVLILWQDFQEALAAAVRIQLRLLLVEQ